MTIKKNFLYILTIFIIYLFLMLGGILNNILLKGIGLLSFYLIILLLPLKVNFYLLSVFTINLSLFCITNDSFGLLGIAYIIVFLKIYIFNDKSISFSQTLISIALLIFGVVRIRSNNYYDIALISQALVTIFVWKYYIKNISQIGIYNIIDGFFTGSIFLLIGMLIQYAFTDVNKFYGVLDNANYTAATFGILFTLSLYFIVRNINYTKKYILAFISIIGGLMTGSRGFIVSILAVVLVYLIYSLKNKRARKIISSFVVGFILFFGLYLINFGPAVYVWDSIILRTVQLSLNYREGYFMDISSGRLVLWDYYLRFLSQSNLTALFGKGFYNYHLIENGGYGLAVHNTIVSGIIGFGLIGVILTFILYFSIGKHKKVLFIPLTILLNFMITYFFIDGLLDLRFAFYFVIYYICLHLEEVVMKKRIKYEQYS